MIKFNFLPDFNRGIKRASDGRVGIDRDLMFCRTLANAAGHLIRALGKTNRRTATVALPFQRNRIVSGVNDDDIGILDVIGVVAELSSPQDSPSEFCMLTSRYDEARTSPLPDEELEII